MTIRWTSELVKWNKSDLLVSIKKKSLFLPQFPSHKKNSHECKQILGFFSPIMWSMCAFTIHLFIAHRRLSPNLIYILIKNWSKWSWLPAVDDVDWNFIEWNLILGEIAFWLWNDGILIQTRTISERNFIKITISNHFSRYATKWDIIALHQEISHFTKSFTLDFSNVLISL